MGKEIDITNEVRSPRIYIPIEITVNGQTNTCNALIDTGASLTCIDETFIPDGTVFESQIPIIGVNDGGKDIQDLVRNQYRADIHIPALDVTFKNVLATSTKDNDKSILGMNIIKYLKFQIDNGKWTLAI